MKNPIESSEKIALIILRLEQLLLKKAALSSPDFSLWRLLAKFVISRRDTSNVWVYLGKIFQMSRVHSQGCKLYPLDDIGWETWPSGFPHFTLNFI